MKYVLMDCNHVEAVAELEKICFHDPWSVNSIVSVVTNPLSCWIVAMDDDRLVGYVGSQSVLGWADMMNLAVHPDCRRCGIGERLVSELINRLKSSDVTCLTLEVRVSNTAARQLYETERLYSQRNRSVPDPGTDAGEHDQHHRFCQLHPAGKQRHIRLCHLCHVFGNVPGRCDSGSPGRQI